MASGRHTGPLSLWTCPQREPLDIDPRRWADYPYFLYALRDSLALDEDESLPETVHVVWLPFEDFTKYPLGDLPQERMKETSFVRSVVAKFERGEDVPPLIRKDGAPDDGCHRAWAAKLFGYTVAPTIVLS